MSFTPFTSNANIKDSYSALIACLEANFNHNAGEQFPTGTLEVGTLCYRTDKKALYVLTDLENETWELVAPEPEIATTTQAVEGTNDTLVMTPKKVKESVLENAPKVSVSTSVQAIDGTDDTTMMTPKKVKEVADKVGEETDTKISNAMNVANPYTQVEVNNLISKAKTDTLLLSYPVGAIYISVVSTSPATLFGGTWEKLPEGRMLLAQGGSYKAGSTGGESSHKLTIDEMPSHKHGLTKGYRMEYGNGGNENAFQVKSTYSSNNKPDAMSSVGGNGYHNNMPPYLSVYMWKRTA